MDLKHELVSLGNLHPDMERESVEDIFNCINKNLRRRYWVTQILETLGRKLIDEAIGEERATRLADKSEPRDIPK